ncbi:hypothetical protein ACTFIZ_004256 [Dictyostelium cf. discoideum]
MNTVLNNINQSRYFNDSTANTKIEEIKKHLDSPSDADKLESMKKLIAMLSKGRDVSEAFPQVVKNVIVKNLEIKKLVYMYLVHYAESQNDSALLSINTIQKSLNDQSQVIRASALRVMSSIRVIDIIEVIILAIEKSVKDTSPFVRKAAAFAIAKVHKLDCDKQEPLVELLEVLLNDTSTMVLGAAIVAFNELCPQRFDLLHQHYRKICQLLADFDEWSQVIVLDILTKYARSQFRCPDSTMNDKNIKQFKKKSKSFYSDEEDQEDDETDNSLYKKKPLERDMFDSSEEIDMDHRLLLKSTLPLLQSRNNAVVMAVSSLYFYCAPSIEAQKVGKSLVRILRSGPEVQYITLTNISTMVTLRPSMFEPHLSEFFIHSSDPDYSIKLKLEILTRLATPENIGKILKEFKEYVKNEDKKFVAATIQAIGSCASTVPDVTESCIYGLMSLLSNQSTVVVAESVIVLKRLLQLNATNEKLEKLEKENHVKDNHSTISKHSSSNNSIKYDNIILHLSKLLDTLQVPSARASIVWVIGEYCYRVPLVAPDVFRKLVKSFSDEHESVKLETLNLGSKLYVQFTDGATTATATTDNAIPNEFKNERTKEKITLMFQYVLNLAKFDQNYDIRDNSRMLKHFYFNTENTQSINSNIKQIVINQKPIPTETSISEDRQRFTLGSLSHIVNHTALGYTALPDFPDVAPDPSVREPIQRWIPNQQSQQQQQLNNIFVDTPFYSDEEEEEEEEEYDEEEEEEEEEEYEEQNEYEDFFGEEKKKKKKNRKQQNYDEDEYNQDIDDGEYDGEGEVQDEDDFDELFGITHDDNNQTTNGISSEEMDKFDFENYINSTTTTTTKSVKKILLKPTISGGLSIDYCFIRIRDNEEYSCEPRYNIIQLNIKNQSDETFSDISIINKNLIDGADISEFVPIESIEPNQTIQKQINVLFNSTSQSCKFEISFNKGNFPVTLTPIIGELLIPIVPIYESISQWKDEFEEVGEFKQVDDQFELGDQCLDKLNNNNNEGSDENIGLMPILPIVLESINLIPIASNKSKSKIQFASKTLLKDENIYVQIQLLKQQPPNVDCIIRSNDQVVSALLLKKLKDVLQK